MDSNLQLTETIVEMAEEAKITNTQEYIDYEIALCNLSTKDHNK